MRFRIGSTATTIAIVLAATLPTFAASSASALSVAPRYATPQGTGTSCTKSHPCDITTAVNDAAGGAEVIIGPGSYGSAKHPLSTELTDTGRGHLLIHGAAGAPMPQIYSSADYAIYILDSSTVSDLAVHATGTGGGVFVYQADHLIVQSATGSDGACTVYGVLSESVCISTGANTPAVELSTDANVTATVSDVTGVATGSGGVGLLVAAIGTNTSTINASGDIFHGTGYDVDLRPGATGTADLTPAYSSFDTVKPESGNSNVIPSATNINSVKFVDLAALDLREKASSPTVDHGAPESSSTTDVVGDPRVVGVAADMGAYEFLPKATVGKLTATKVTKHKIEVATSVNDGGLPTHLKLVATAGKHTKKSPGVKLAGAPVTAKQTLVVSGLAPHTKYSLHVTAKNLAGTTKSKAIKVKTR